MMVRATLSLPIILSLLLICGAAWATESLYSYKDAKGVLHLTNVLSNSRFRPVYSEETRITLNPREKKKIIFSVIERASRRHSIDPSLVKAVVKAESDFDPYAVSYAGAKGLMQLMPETAESLDVINPFNIEENIFGGIKHLKQLLKQFEGDIKLSVAAYNAGRSAVLRYGGVPPYKETTNYVKKVMVYYENYKNVSRKD